MARDKSTDGGNKDIKEFKNRASLPGAGTTIVSGSEDHLMYLFVNL